MGLTEDPAALRRMNLLWGVEPVAFESSGREDQMETSLSRLCLEHDITQPGSHVVVLSASSLEGDGPVTTLRLVEVGEGGHKQD